MQVNKSPHSSRGAAADYEMWTSFIGPLFQIFLANHKNDFDSQIRIVNLFIILKALSTHLNSCRILLLTFLLGQG